MKLLLVRHGETIENRDLILLGMHQQGTLSEKGVQQAQDTSDKLNGRNIDIAYSSDLRRASHTAQIIMANHKGTPLVMVKELRERDVGEMANKKAKDIEELFAFGLGPNKEGETLEALQKRVVDFTNKIYSEHKGDVVLFVCHGGIIKAILNAIENRPASELPNIRTPGNAEIFELDIKGPIGLTSSHE